MSNTWSIGDRVQVSLPFGANDQTVHLATISRILEPGPHDPAATVKVLFDDPLIYGGTGTAWVEPWVLAREGAEPVKIQRNYVIG